MPFDNTTRNRLQRLVSDCRDLLTREFDAKLKELYGIYADEGRVLDLEKLATLDDEKLRVASLLRERINHLASSGGGTPAAISEAVKRLLREQAFTVLNRFAALRMAEERGIIVESVGGGLNSKGFKTYSEVAHSGLGSAYERYRVFLGCMFDEMATDLGVLFDRRSPYGLLFPRENVLLEMFGLLNAPEVKPLWKEDETVGWIYQYFNDPAERKKMRELSAAPRNSRELAVRNQFFTPRYVVEFLTDNTLGRIWYEMCGGSTSLNEKCRYLVRRPNEVFLKPDETPPATNTPNAAKESPSPPSEGRGEVGQPSTAPTQEELLKQPVFIPHRPIKDPRTILMLDPACGSMHFGLYAFDLYEIIYDEAWDLEGVAGAPSFARPAEMKSLRETFATKEEFLRQVPRLIIEHNLHGIDIDPRCAQIAGLSLWLRAQRSWKDMGIAPAQRPRITRSNIVCAEPMPGEKELLREFVEKEFPAAERGVFLQLLETIFDKMQLAGEAGSLLKIEEEISSAIEAARAAWQKLQTRPAELFSTGELNAVSKQAELDATADLRLLTSDFFARVEERIYAALRDYAEQAENGGGFQRRLFAEDMARGFAFIDISRKRYDAALMNPPFGDASLPSKSYIEDTYGDTKGDVYKAFVECFQVRLVPAGHLGIISSRTGFFLGQSEDWRTRVVLRLFRPIALADLGMGVLDAMVEVAAYVLRSLSDPEARDLTHSIVPMLHHVVRDKQDRFSLPKWQTARDGLKRHQAVAELENLEANGFIQRSLGDVVRYKPLWQAVNQVSAPPKPHFPLMTCIRALAEQDKGAALLVGISDQFDSRRFMCNPSEFKTIPGAPFAYWISPRVRALFSTLPPLEADGRTARRGPSTGNDFRVVRVWWEVPPVSNVKGQQWVSFAKGGKFSRFYADPPAMVAWDPERFTFSGFFGRPGRMLERLESSDVFFRPGITWPLRGIRFSAQVFPSGGIFSIGGKLATCDDRSRLTELLAIANSKAFDFWIGLFAGKVGGVQYESGLISKVPYPRGTEATGLGELGYRGWASRRSVDSGNAISHAFSSASLLTVAGSSIAERAAAWAARLRKSQELIDIIQVEIDTIAFRLYGLDAVECAALTATVAAEPTAADSIEVGEDEEEDVDIADTAALTADLFAYAIGCAFGRWDIRYATGEQAAPELPDPFAPLPVCPPGQLQNAQGLPARPEDVPAAYPLKHIPWAGILVDDESHQCDLVGRVREVIEIIWAAKGKSTPHPDPLPDRGGEGGATPESIEHEACEILGVKSLRDYFRKPAGFFADHLKRYSKSRRQAPIYWPLSTASGSYTLWIYYHRLTDQTLFQCVNDFVKPKITEVEGDLSRLTTVGADKPGARGEIERLTILRAELVEFRDELLRVAQLPYKPNLNDGVLITASPLWKLFRLPKWQRDLKACWTALENEEYEWAHLAYTLWPDRVKAVCKKDRSIAIAHGLEELCDVKAPAKKGKKKTDQMEMEETE